MTDLGWPEFQSLARNVAGELGTRRAETWTVAAWHENPARPAATLDGPGAAQLFIHYGAGGADKITISGLLPEGTYAGRRFTANVDPARGARAIAQAADTRVLRAGYLDILPGNVAQKHANDAAIAARDAAAAKAAELFGVPAPDDGMLYLRRFLPSGAAQARFTTGGTVSLDLDGVPQETALRILAVLASDMQAACCYSLGPGHHPDLSTAGCLREDAERGHDASQQRAIRLLAAHGIDTGRAGPLLDAAYRGDPRGNYDDGTGIKVGYDRDHGEFTVSIPRQERVSSPPAPGQGADSRAQAAGQGQLDRTGASAGQSAAFPYPLPGGGALETGRPKARETARPRAGQQIQPPTRGRSQ